MLKKIIEINGRKFPYSLKLSGRSRHIKLTVCFNGELIATVPKNFNENFISEFISKKSDWIIDKIDYFKKLAESVKLGEKIIIKGSRDDYLKNKEKARILIKEKISRFNKIYNFEIKRISIKNHKSCWGSCSKKGNLNFNYKIIFLPERLADYIIAHEICHLKEFNHSKNFWNLVKISIPNCLEIKKELQNKVINLY